MRSAECQGERRSASDLSLQFRIPRSALRIGCGAVTVWDSDRVTRALGASGPRGLRFPGGVATDTRHLTPGALFVALQGDRFDAHAFLDQAKAQGAAAAVVRQGTAPVQGLPFLEVPDTPVALGLLARARRRRLPPGHPRPGGAAGGMQGSLARGAGAGVRGVGPAPPELAVEARRRARTVAAGPGPEAGVRPDTAELDDGGRPRLTWRGHTVTLPVVGFHQIENALIALAVGREVGADPARAVAALAGVRLPGGRGAMLELGGLTVIDDTYNANPGSLHWAVKFAHWLAQRRGRPLAGGVGSMLGLGPESARLHALAAAEIAALAPAVVAAVGGFVPAFEPPRTALGPRLVMAPDVDGLRPRPQAAVPGGEIVLLKASRGVALERVLPHLN